MVIVRLTLLSNILYINAVTKELMTDCLYKSMSDLHATFCFKYLFLMGLNLNVNHIEGAF